MKLTKNPEIEKLETVSVDWWDASDMTEKKFTDILQNTTREYMVKRRSVGYLINEDKYGIVIATDIDEDENCEITTIPKKFVYSVTVK